MRGEMRTLEDSWKLRKLGDFVCVCLCMLAVSWEKSFNSGNNSMKDLKGTSLVIQWLRIHLPMQGTQVRSLVWEDPTCHKATKRVYHNYWAHVLEPWAATTDPLCSYSSSERSGVKLMRFRDSCTLMLENLELKTSLGEVLTPTSVPDVFPALSFHPRAWSALPTS